MTFYPQQPLLKTTWTVLCTSPAVGEDAGREEIPPCQLALHLDPLAAALHLGAFLLRPLDEPEHLFRGFCRLGKIQLHCFSDIVTLTGPKHSQ